MLPVTRWSGAGFFAGAIISACIRTWTYLIDPEWSQHPFSMYEVELLAFQVGCLGAIGGSVCYLGYHASRGIVAGMRRMRGE
jgi:hypothetical protein